MEGGTLNRSDNSDGNNILNVCLLSSLLTFLLTISGIESDKEEDVQQGEDTMVSF